MHNLANVRMGDRRAARPSAARRAPARPVDAPADQDGPAGTTWSRKSIRHSDLRRRTVEQPLVVQFSTGVLPSQKRKGSTYVAFRVRGDVGSYTYEPENEAVEQHLRAVTEARQDGDWFRLTARGREADAELIVLPLERPADAGGIPRATWAEIRADFAAAYQARTGTDLQAEALEQALLVLMDAAEAAPAAAPTGPGRTPRHQAALDLISGTFREIPVAFRATVDGRLVADLRRWLKDSAAELGADEGLALQAHGAMRRARVVLEIRRGLQQQPLPAGSAVERIHRGTRNEFWRRARVAGWEQEPMRMLVAERFGVASTSEITRGNLEEALAYASNTTLAHLYGAVAGSEESRGTPAPDAGAARGRAGQQR